MKINCTMECSVKFTFILEYVFLVDPCLQALLIINRIVLGGWKVHYLYRQGGREAAFFGGCGIIVPLARRRVMKIGGRVIVCLVGIAAILAVFSCSNSKDSLSPQDTQVKIPDVSAEHEFYPFDEPPRLVKYEKPEFPEGIEGKIDAEVLLKLKIDENGNVENVLVMKSSDERFEDEAVRAARSFQFTPAKLKGQPTKCFVAVPIRFTKKG